MHSVYMEVGQPMQLLSGTDLSQVYTVKPCKEEPRKLRTNRLFLKILYPLVKNQCQGVLE